MAVTKRKGLSSGECLVQRENTFWNAWGGRGSLLRFNPLHSLSNPPRLRFSRDSLLSLPPPSRRGWRVVDLCGGVSTVLMALLASGHCVDAYWLSEIDQDARTIGDHIIDRLNKHHHANQLHPNFDKSSGVLPNDITLITEEMIIALGRINLFSSAWPCTDLSSASREDAQGLDGDRSALFSKLKKFLHGFGNTTHIATSSRPGRVSHDSPFFPRVTISLISRTRFSREEAIPRCLFRRCRADGCAGRPRAHGAHAFELSRAGDLRGAEAEVWPVPPAKAGGR